MKTKLNLTIESDLIPLSKKYAQTKGMSVSQLVEGLLRQIISKEKTGFSEKWRGKFKAVKTSDSRYQQLETRYLK